jgi:hypothetical protein
MAKHTRYIYWPSGTQAGEIEGAISSEISSRVFSPLSTATTWDIGGLREGDWSVHFIANSEQCSFGPGHNGATLSQPSLLAFPAHVN